MAALGRGGVLGITAQVAPAEVLGEDEEDVGFGGRGELLGGVQPGQRRQQQDGESEEEM